MTEDKRQSVGSGENVTNQIRAEAPVGAYEKMYEDESAYDLPYTQSHYYPMFRKTLSEVERTGGRSIIEVGCGSGSFAEMLLDHTDKTYRGFDFSEAGIARL